MAKNDFARVTPGGSYPLGNAKEAKDASDYTGFKYPSGGGNDIGTYKQPMLNPNGNEEEAVSMRGNGFDETNMSIGGASRLPAKVNKHGEKTMRGYGAATKGIKTRGPMA
jgi:hypothetical protein